MTEPPDSLPPDGRDEPNEPVDDAAVARLRAMLRDEPVKAVRSRATPARRRS